MDIFMVLHLPMSSYGHNLFLLLNLPLPIHQSGIIEGCFIDASALALATIITITIWAALGAMLQSQSQLDSYHRDVYNRI